MTDAVLVTGIGGFIAKHVAKALLDAGFQVRGTVRSAAASETVTAMLRSVGSDVSRLTFVEADLDDDKPWRAAVNGCRYVLHLASPFPMQQPRDRETLVPAARAGAIRVLDAALSAGADRIVMTSSMVAMMYRAGRPPVVPVSHSGPRARPCSTQRKASLSTALCEPASAGKNRAQIHTKAQS